jgi:hypothetical protein
MAISRGALKTRAQARPIIILDKKRLARYQVELDRLRRARVGEAEDWDNLYEAAGNIIQGELYVMDERRFKSARAFLQAEMPGLDERTVRQYARVARCFDPADEQEHGIAKLDALVEYLTAASGAAPAPAKINLEKQRILVGEGQWVRFSEASRETIRRATRLLKASSDKQPAKMSALVKGIKKALSAAGAGAVGVRVADGKVLLSVKPAELQTLGRALAKIKLAVTD